MNTTIAAATAAISRALWPISLATIAIVGAAYPLGKGIEYRRVGGESMALGALPNAGISDAPATAARVMADTEALMNVTPLPLIPEAAPAPRASMDMRQLQPANYVPNSDDFQKVPA